MLHHSAYVIHLSSSHHTGILSRDVIIRGLNTAPVTSAFMKGERKRIPQPMEKESLWVVKVTVMGTSRVQFLFGAFLWRDRTRQKLLCCQIHRIQRICILQISCHPWSPFCLSQAGDTLKLIPELTWPDGVSKNLPVKEDADQMTRVSSRRFLQKGGFINPRRRGALTTMTIQKRSERETRDYRGNFTS